MIPKKNKLMKKKRNTHRTLVYWGCLKFIDVQIVNLLSLQAFLLLKICYSGLRWPFTASPLWQEKADKWSTTYLKDKGKDWNLQINDECSIFCKMKWDTHKALEVKNLDQCLNYTPNRTKWAVFYDFITYSDCPDLDIWKPIFQKWIMRRIMANIHELLKKWNVTWNLEFPKTWNLYSRCFLTRQRVFWWDGWW